MENFILYIILSLTLIDEDQGYESLVICSILIFIATTQSI